MPKIKLEDITVLVDAIETYSRDLNLREPGTILEYTAGNSANGVCAKVQVVFYYEDGGRTVMPESFLPVFVPKTTREQQYRELTATLKVLRAMFRLKEKYTKVEPKLTIHPSFG